MANRVAMADYLDPARFKWVFFVDCFMFPFDNTALATNPDRAVYMPLQTKLLQRYAQQLGLPSPLPETFREYLSFLTRTLEENKRRGGVAVKFEASYFRSLSFGDPGGETVEPIYRKYRGGGVPTPEEYTRFQDFIFRHIIIAAVGAEAARAHSHLGRRRRLLQPPRRQRPQPRAGRARSEAPRRRRSC